MSRSSSRQRSSKDGSRQATRPSRPRSQSTIPPSSPSTIQPTIRPQLSTQAVSQLRGSTYQSSCNAFEHMKTLKGTVHHWADLATPQLTADQKKTLSGLTSIVDTYARTADTETEVKQDLARTTHTALKRMSRLYKSAANSQVRSDASSDLTKAWSEIGDMIDQRDPAFARTMAKYIDNAQSTRQSTIGKKVYGTARSAVGWAYNRLFNGDDTPAASTYVPDSRAFASFAPGHTTQMTHNATMTEDGHWIVPDSHSTLQPSASGGRGLFWEGASALGTLGLAGISAAATALSNASSAPTRLLDKPVSAFNASSAANSSARLLGSSHIPSIHRF